jgi:putative glutamine amidotransferase
VASAADGVIEAVEATDAEWIFGVQWHPELNADSNRRQAALFVSLAVAAAAYARRKR